MRMVSALAIFIATMSFGAPAQAQYQGKGRWCATVYFGVDGSQSDCSFNTIDQCSPHVIAGNKGFCELNPHWQGDRPARARKPNRKRG